MEPKGRLTEDWLAVFTGLFLFLLSLAIFFGGDLLGWVITTSVWTDIGKALAPASKTWGATHPLVSLFATWGFLTVLLGLGARALGADFGRFAKAFTARLFSELPVLDRRKLGAHRRHAR